MENQGRKYIAELLGTFCLMFIGTSVATLQGFIPGHDGTSWLEISAAFGGTLAVLVLVIGPVSGCHVNPAVSIAMVLSKHLDGRDLSAESDVFAEIRRIDRSDRDS